MSYDQGSYPARPWRYSMVQTNGASRYDDRARYEDRAYDYEPERGERMQRVLPPPRGFGAKTSKERSLGEIFNSLWRRKFSILGGMLVAGLIAYVVASSMTPRYTANGMLAVETRPLFIPQIGVQPQPWAPDISIPRTEVQVLQSRELIESVARQLELDKQPDLNPYLAEPSPFARISGMIGGTLRAIMSSLGLTSPRSNEGPSEEAVWAAVVDRVLEHLVVGTDGRSYAIYVGFDSENPAVSSGVVNTVMQGFITKQIEISNQTLIEANTWIKQRSVELLRDVEEVNRRVQEFRVKHGLAETRAGTVSSQQLNEVNTQLSTARADLAQAEARYQQAQSEAKTNAGSTAVEVLSSPLIQRLRDREAEAAQKEAEMSARLAPSHPQRRAVARELSTLRAQTNREIDKLLKSLQSQVTIARSREQSLARQQSSLESRATTVAGSEAQLHQLEQEAETKRNVYQSFLATAQQTAEPSRINQANARIVSAASTPVYPSGPNKKLIVLGAVLVAFLLAAALTLLFGELNRGFEDAEEIEEALGLPVLGALPLMRRRRIGKQGLGQSIIGQPHESIIAETLRGVRIAIGSRRGHKRSQIVLVTSSEPSEGKTTFASSMAAVAAQDGLRVLIVDSDLRRPQFHRMFKAEPGHTLPDLLDGSQTLADVVRLDPESGAHCLTTKDHVDNPVNLLTSERWVTFLEQARSSYDLIILDSPPIMHVADALTLAEHADSAIFVVSYGSTRRRIVEEALKRFASTGTRVSGIILSKVPSLRTTHSYYGGYAA